MLDAHNMECGKTRWRIWHRAVTESTNADALGGVPGDVFTADLQRSGRGRLSHRWLSPAGENLMMSVVLDVGEMPPDVVATLPIAVGLAVANSVSSLLYSHGACLPSDRVGGVRIKWPNDILVDGRKVCGILCERNGDCAIAGIGVNVNQTEFAPEIADRATSLRAEIERHLGVGSASFLSVIGVRDAVLAEMDEVLGAWRSGGLAGILPDVARFDYLKGRFVSVRRTDDDENPVEGVCGGILPDGALEVGGVPVYAGEAHILHIA